MAGITITKSKYNELVNKLSYLENEKTKEISDALNIARGFGDLSENAEYSAAKDAQNANEAEIARLKDTIAQAIVIDENAISTHSVSIGTRVKVLDLEENEEIEYNIVSTLEVNSRENKISDKSPIGKALIGHGKGETVVAATPCGNLSFKILEISK